MKLIFLLIGVLFISACNPKVDAESDAKKVVVKAYAESPPPLTTGRAFK